MSKLFTGVAVAAFVVALGAPAFAATETVKGKIVDQAWRKRSWALWIDGQRVSLGRFGTSDRWIPSLAEANGRRVLLREWSIILIGAKGRHTVRYSSQRPHSVHSTTWKFTVLAR